ncbi:terminase TerL endonuclease subunit [Bacillus thuringiensis]|uniref:terminase TerL endonuclease subunit n=3 Tax=Bacillus cereus group TaxID=86661 RepID=UPI000B71CCC9|nr:terminase TerL endonuclease subunit [Bacillus thuringiensis]MEC2865972.1 terminase large subunit [Bacillus cereus]OTZ67156.1 terminase [Bacillus thuringiensis serovar tohokuensis]OTZ67284.1 terminase [Bacillus thuringiensis serovar tohokuensis]OTZ67366.1 terminase [Bacillus thuringiensis serovar tohokuensis]OTZ82445.1 terminase [Bacillus thuringiensis serovar tohokuensis]
MTMTNYKYHPYIDNYINMVESGQVKSSKEVKLLMGLLKKKLSQNNIVINHDEITEAKECIERYFPFELLPHQDFILACCVGLFYDDGTLVFNEFLILMGRGAGKNGFIAALAFYLVSKQGIRGYNVDIVATSKEQALTSFMDVHDVLEEYKKRMKKFFKWTLEKIVYKKTKSKIKYYTNNAKTKDGLRPGVVIFDEIHAYESYDNIKVFTSALGKVQHPRRFYLTTDGDVRGGVLDDFKDVARQVLNGELPNSRMFPFLCKLDDESEVDDFEMWEKANPSLPYFPHLKQEMETEYENMQTRPSARIEFMTKRMNLPQEETMFSVASWEQIKATDQEFPLEELKGQTCVGGIDFSDINDFVGVGLLFKYKGKRYWKHHTFINRQALKNKNFKIDIQVAIDEGLVTIIDDVINKPEHILGWFIKQAKIYNIKSIASDLYRINYIKQIFEEAGFHLEIARSGKVTHTKLQPVVEEMFATESIVYGADRMMRWYTNNVYVDKDSKGNISYEKIEPYLRKTDGFMALIHALTLDGMLKEGIPITKETIKKMFRVFGG